MHYTYDDILRAAQQDALVHEPGNYRYVKVVLHKGDTCDNPGSTKHSLWGPATFLWEISPMSVRATHREDVPVKLGAAVLDTPVRAR